MGKHRKQARLTHNMGCLRPEGGRPGADLRVLCVGTLPRLERQSKMTGVMARVRAGSIRRNAPPRCCWILERLAGAAPGDESFFISGMREGQEVEGGLTLRRHGSHRL